MESLGKPIYIHIYVFFLKVSLLSNIHLLSNIWSDASVTEMEHLGQSGEGRERKPMK